MLPETASGQPIGGPPSTPYPHVPKKKAKPRKPPVLKKVQKPITITTKIKGKKKRSPFASDGDRMFLQHSQEFQGDHWLVQPQAPPSDSNSVRGVGSIWKNKPKSKAEADKRYRCVKRETDACVDEWNACCLDGGAATVTCLGVGITVGSVTGVGSIIGGILFSAACATYYLASCHSKYSACTKRAWTTCDI